MERATPNESLGVIGPFFTLRAGVAFRVEAFGWGACGAENYPGGRMETSNRPSGGVPGFQLIGLKIHVWTVRFCPWAQRRTNREVVRTAASALARGTMSLRTARAAFGVTRLLEGRAS